MIRFRPLDMADLPLMHRWLNTPHVQQWYEKDGATPEWVKQHYGTAIRRERATRSYLILLDGAPIGYIQAYRIADYPDYAQHLQLDEDAAGVDLFIGEPGCVHRGIGSAALQQFVHEVVFGEMGAASCILGPEPDNRAAIRAYEKAGFRYLRTVQPPDEPQPEYLMRLGADEVAPAPEEASW